MSETPQRAPAALVQDAVKRMGSLSKLLCPIQRDLENLTSFLAEREKDDSVVPRKDYDAMKLDLEGLKKQVSELSSVHASMKTKIDTLTTEKNDLQKQIHELEQESQESDRIRTRMERYLSERDSLRAQKSGWEREKMTLGHRFLNWLLRIHSVSYSSAADSALRSWMHDEKMLENGSAKSDFESSDDFTVCPRNLSGVPRQFPLPEPPSKQPDPDKDSGSKGPSTGKDPPPSSTPARATDLSKSGAKSTEKAPQKSKSTPPKSDGGKKKPDSTDFDESELDFGIGSRPAKQASDRAESARKPSPKGKSVLKTKGSDISKKRSGCESASDSTKRSRMDASPKKPKPSTLTIKDMLGSDTHEEALVPPDDTGKLIREIRDVYADVYRSKPWRRYLSATGSFLPDIPDTHPSHPRHAESCGDVWTRMFMTSAKTGTKAWERLVYRLTRLVAELYILINHSDFKEDLIRFLCHPHPAWPEIFKNPINLLAMGKQLSREVAINYLTSQSTKIDLCSSLKQDAGFWEVQPDVSRIEESGSDEDGADQGKEASGADSEYEEHA
ncbi:hypothetical protein AC1031_005775 [Aphanomyces cochlioides]|nr:hypothetical protein AC1031_005775 [Aphanomyces cochlioides]